MRSAAAPRTTAGTAQWHARPAAASCRSRRLPPVAAAAGQQTQQQQEEAAATSLIPETLREMEGDTELQALHARVQREGQAALTREEAKRRQRSLDALGVAPFGQVLAASGAPPLARGPTTILQLNIGLYCNQACRHCHVESSPMRTEMMSREVAERCVALMAASAGSIATIDITGGAPELMPEFRYLVREARRLGLEVLDRCNLTVLLEPGQEDLVQFLAEQRVRVVASLPCYSADNVNTQRGGGVFDRSIRALQMLNAAGYGVEGSGLTLDLVYNPGGAFLAPPQSTLEPAYRQELGEAYGITFSSLLCLNNMPIKRWADHLAKGGQLEEYMKLLVDAFNPAAAAGLMCRDTLSVGWDGRLYDCDFNQQLELPLPRAAWRTVFDIDSLEQLAGEAIAVGSHCFGCTAGAGSGCGGQSVASASSDTE